MKKVVLVLVAFSLALSCIVAAMPTVVEAVSVSPHVTDPGDGVRQLIQGFVDTSGEDVTVEGIVAFLNGLVDARPSGSMTITYGSEYVFNPATTYYVSAAALSGSQFVVAYRDDGNSSYGTAMIGNVSGATITYGAEYVFNPAATDYISAVALSGSKFVVAYTDNGNSYYGTAVIGDVSGSAISYGSEYVFNPAGTQWASAAALSDSKFVVAYEDFGNSYYGTAVIGDVSGSTISYGSEYVFNPAGTVFIAAAALSSSKLVVAYCDGGNSNYYGTACIGDVSGSIISYGSEYTFNPASTSYISAAALSSSKFVATYRDDGYGSYGMAIIGNVSGSVISYGSEYVFNPGLSIYISVTALSDSQFVVAYCDWDNSIRGTARSGAVSGSVISYGSEYVFCLGVTYYISAATLSGSQFVAAYQNATNSSYGTAAIGDYTPDPTPTPTPTASPTPTVSPTISPTVSPTVSPTESPTPTCTAPPSGMVSWWKADGNADDSIDGNDGTLQGTTASYASGKVGQAFHLVSDGDYVALPDAASYLISNSGGAIAAWVNPTSIGNDIVIAFGDATGCGGLGLGVRTNHACIYHHACDWDTIALVSTNEWTFLAYTWNSTTETIYKNGAFCESHARSFNYNPRWARIGNGFWGSFPSENQYHGLIDEVTVFNRELSADEIATIYNVGSAGMCAVTPTPTPTATPEAQPGDVNDDGRINCCDITQEELCILYPETYPKENYPGWDANEDDEGPNAGDILAVEMRILGTWPP